MRLENYRKEDIYDVIEKKNLMVHQLDELEVNFWTDDVRRAKQLITDLYAGICELEKLQVRKSLEDLAGELNGLGIDTRILINKKTD